MKRFILPLVALVIGCAGPVQAELTAGQMLAAKVLIKQFQSREFAKRQQAVDKLVAMGPDVVPLVRKTLAETDDAEVKLRCKMVLKGIAENQGGGDDGTPRLTEARRLRAGAARVTLDVRDADFADVLVSLAHQSGNRVMIPRERMDVLSITLNVKDRPYWEVLDAVCESARVRYEQNYRGRRVKFVPQRGAAGPSTTVGPVNFRAVPAGPEEVPPEKSVVLRIEYFWEDRLPVGGTELTITKAISADGRVLQPVNAGRPDYWGGFFSSADRAKITLRYAGRPPERIAEVHGMLKLYLAVGQAALTLDDVLNPAAPRKGRLSVSNTHKTEKGVWLTVSLSSPDGKRAVMGPLGAPRYSFHLIDPDGKRYPCHKQYVGTAHVSERLDGHLFVLSFPDELCISGRTIGFRVLPQVDKGWKLECLLPRRTIVREYAFTFKDITIPPRRALKKEGKR